MVGALVDPDQGRRREARARAQGFFLGPLSWLCAPEGYWRKKYLGPGNTGVVRVLSTYPPSDASRRLRIEPLKDALLELGYTVRPDTILSDRAFAAKNLSGLKRLPTIVRLFCGLVRRLFVLFFARSEIVLVHREAFLYAIFRTISVQACGGVRLGC